MAKIHGAKKQVDPAASEITLRPSASLENIAQIELEKAAENAGRTESEVEWIRDRRNPRNWPVGKKWKVRSFFLPTSSDTRS